MSWAVEVWEIPSMGGEVVDLDAFGAAGPDRWHKPADWTVATGISDWNDSGADALDLTQGTAANQPAVLSPWQNGLDAADFVAVSSHFLEQLTPFSSLGPVTVALVAEFDSLSTSFPLGLTGNFDGIYIDGVGEVVFRTSNAGATLATSGAGVAAGSKYIIALSRDASNQLHCFVNGVDFSTLNTNAESFDLLGWLGRNATLGFFDGKVGELAIWRSEDLSADLESISDALNARWAVY